MFKIGEFSKLTQVSVRMLRYYDQTGLLTPAQTDSHTGYRLYSADQIPTLNKIIYLRDSGFNVTEITDAIKSPHEASITELLDKKYNEITANIQAEHAKLSKINTARKGLLQSRSNLHYDISIKSIPSYHVLSLRKTIPSYYDEHALWEELSQYAKHHKLKISDETFSIYHDNDYKEDNVDVELCTVIHESQQTTGSFKCYHTAPIPLMACTMVYGSFSNIAASYQSLADWLEINSQYTLSGANRQIIHRGPWNEENQENYLTEIQIPLTKVE